MAPRGGGPLRVYMRPRSVLPTFRYAPDGELLIFRVASRLLRRAFAAVPFVQCVGMGHFALVFFYFCGGFVCPNCRLASGAVIGLSGLVLVVLSLQWFRFICSLGRRFVSVEPVGIRPIVLRVSHGLAVFKKRSNYNRIESARMGCTAP